MRTSALFVLILFALAGCGVAPRLALGPEPDRGAEPSRSSAQPAGEVVVHAYGGDGDAALVLDRDCTAGPHVDTICTCVDERLGLVCEDEVLVPQTGNEPIAQLGLSMLRVGSYDDPDTYTVHLVRRTAETVEVVAPIASVVFVTYQGEQRAEITRAERMRAGTVELLFIEATVSGSALVPDAEDGGMEESWSTAFGTVCVFADAALRCPVAMERLRSTSRALELGEPIDDGHETISAVLRLDDADLVLDRATSLGVILQRRFDLRAIAESGDGPP